MQKQHLELSKASLPPIQDNTTLDPSKDEANPQYKSPQEKANIFSYMHFLFMLPTAIKARKLMKQHKSLDGQSLPGFPYRKRAEVLEGRFFDHIKKQKIRRPSRKVSLALSILSSLKWPIITNIFLGMTALFLRIFIVWITKRLLESLSEMYVPVSDGYKWAGILSALLLVTLYIDHQFFYHATVLPMHVRSGIISMIYTKITRLSVYSLNQISLGKLVNLVANDVNVFERTGIFFSFLFVGIFGLIGSTALLWIFFGPSCLVGIGYCIIGFPLQQFLAKMSSKPRDKKNEVTDERVKTTNEVIDGIRLIKMYAWELIFRDAISKIRFREIKFLKQVTSLECLSRGIAFSTQAMASFLIWMTYVLVGNELRISIVFPSIYLIGLLKNYAIFFFSQGLNFVAETKLLMVRVENVLEAQEIGDTHFQEPSNPDNAIEFENFTAHWTKEDAHTAQASSTKSHKVNPHTHEHKPALCNINLNIKQGSLNALIGKVGSGKSSFLLAFTGEMPKTEGLLKYKGSIAYVEQEPTIFAGTLRENILFGKPYKPDFYDQIIKSCNLESDLLLLPNGDLSEIGEKGINLSGGQKARVCLARACYADADIYLLDDPLSAVDAKVAKSLYNEAIVNQLKGKTVILATHQVHFIKDLENIIVMEDGKIIGNGSYEKLSEQNIDVNKIFSSDMKTSVRKPFKNQDSETIETKEIQIQTHNVETHEEEEEKIVLKPDEEKGKLFSSEDTYSGRVNLRTYQSYFSQMGHPVLLLTLFLMYLSNEFANVAFSRIVGVWADGGFERNEALAIMGGITGYILFMYIFKNIVFGQMLLKSARSFHDKMLDKILKNPIQFFDTNPVGRILNRFSNDLGVLDRFLPLTLTDLADQAFLISSTLITIAVINPLILAPMGGALIVIILILKLCYQSITQSRNYELGSRSPLYSLFSSSLAGIIVIRSYRQTENFIQKFRSFLHYNTKGSVGFWSTSRLFGIGVDLTYNLAAIAGIFIVTATKSHNPGLSGLSISFIMSVSSFLQYTLRQCVQTNVLMASVGRIKAYCETTSEAPLVLPGDQEHKRMNWPQEARIELNKVYMKYRPNMDYVIRDLTLLAQPGEKIGCIGRTGAGKSSIIQILFRMIEIDRTAEGTDQSFVKIDNVDSQSLGLHLLRNSISIIPQTPFVFTGTVKRNLDPIGQFTDQQLWDVLEDVGLKTYVENLEDSLDTDMTNASSVFSVGQKQLICLARAILKQSRLLVLDEATANVDLETDNFIQKKIMEKFSDCTIFTIAHRLSTIANYDKVLVLDKGRKVEFDEPYRLLVREIGDDYISNESGHFASMVLNTGPKTSQEILKIAKNKYFESQQGRI